MEIIEEYKKFRDIFGKNRPFYRGISGRIGFLVGTLVTFFNILFIGFYAWNNKNLFDLNAYASTISKTMEQQFQQFEKGEAESLLKVLSALSNNTSLVSAYKNRDREELQRIASPIFSDLNSKFAITHFYFHTPDKVNFLRVHNPGQFGDTIDRITLQKSSENNAGYVGIEFGRTGLFTMRAVTPIFEGQEIIGYLEIGQEIDHFYENKINGMDKFLLIQSGFMKKIMQDNFSPQTLSKMPKIGDYYLAYGTNHDNFGKTVLEQNSSALNQTEGAITEISSGKDTFLVYRRPATYIDGTQFGLGIYFIDITSIIKQRRNAEIFAIIALIAEVLFLIVVSLFGRGWVLRKVAKIKETIFRISQGDLSAKYSLASVNCSDTTGCNPEECPAGIQKGSVCFLECGTFATGYGREITCPLLLKKTISSCLKCKVMFRTVPDEVDEMGAVLNQMSITFGNLIGKLKVLTNNSTKASEILYTTSHRLSDSAQIQAALMEESAASIEELYSSVESISSKTETQTLKFSEMKTELQDLTNGSRKGENEANKAEEKIMNALEKADEGATIVKSTVDTISELKKSTEKITQIVSVITDISDKVNLLSLNASIEAARAGEHGSGFAVVAGEISKLADNTAKSTREIEELVTIGERQSDEGMKMVSKMKDSFMEIMRNIVEVREVINMLSMYSVNSSYSSQQILSKIEELSQMAEQVSGSTFEQKKTSKILSETVENVNNQSQMVANSSRDIAEQSEKITSLAKEIQEDIKFFSQETYS